MRIIIAHLIEHSRVVVNCSTTVWSEGWITPLRVVRDLGIFRIFFGIFFFWILTSTIMVATTSLLKNLLVALFLSYIGKSLYLFLVSLGVGVHHNNVRPGKCRIVPGISCGSEQISVTADGLAFITSGYRDMTRCNRDFLRGGIYVFDFNNPDMNVTKLHIVGESFDTGSFVPHGMDL